MGMLHYGLTLKLINAYLAMNPFLFATNALRDLNAFHVSHHKSMMILLLLANV